MSKGRNTFSIAVDTSGLQQYLKQLGTAAEDAVIPAAKAMAEVYANAAKARITDSKFPHYFYGGGDRKKGKKYRAYGVSGAGLAQDRSIGPIQRFTPGNLRRSIYWAYSPERSGKGYATFAVGYNYKKAPYAHMVEFGTVKTKAVAFIGRTAADPATEAAAIDAGILVLMEAIEKAGK